MGTSSTRVRGRTDAWRGLCHSRDISPHCFSKTFAVPKSNLVHRLVEFRPCGDYDRANNQYCCRARSPPWRLRCVRHCGNYPRRFDAPWCCRRKLAPNAGSANLGNRLVTKPPTTPTRAGMQPRLAALRRSRCHLLRTGLRLWLFELGSSVRSHRTVMPDTDTVAEPH